MDLRKTWLDRRAFRAAGPAPTASVSQNSRRARARCFSIFSKGHCAIYDVCLALCLFWYTKNNEIFVLNIPKFICMACPSFLAWLSGPVPLVGQVVAQAANQRAAKPFDSGLLKGSSCLLFVVDESTSC